MQDHETLEFLPSNFRHEKLFLLKNKLNNFKKLSLLKDSEINKIIEHAPLCTLHNLKKIRAISIFKCKIGITPSEAYLLLHCGISSIKSLSNLNPYELNSRIGRLESILRTKTQTKISINKLKEWIKRASEII